MHSYLAKALAVLILTGLFGIPLGLYTQKFAEDARNMTQAQWLEMMRYDQESYEHSTGFTGMLFLTFVASAGFASIYEFTKWASERVVDGVMGAEGGKSLKP